MKKRRRRTKAPKPETHLVVSYVPLLRGQAGATIPIERAADALESILNTDAGHVQAVVWAQDDSGAPWPILVLEHAAEVFEHLVEWADGSPSTWFKLAWNAVSDEYALALVPKVEKSVERYRIARRLLGEDVPSDARFQIVFRPVQFRGPASPVAQWMLRRLHAAARVGFLPRAELPAALSNIDPTTVRFCGPLEVEHDRTGYLAHLP